MQSYPSRRGRWPRCLRLPRSRSAWCSSARLRELPSNRILAIIHCGVAVSGLNRTNHRTRTSFPLFTDAPAIRRRAAAGPFFLCSLPWFGSAPKAVLVSFLLSFPLPAEPTGLARKKDCGFRSFFFRKHLTHPPMIPIRCVLAGLSPLPLVVNGLSVSCSNSELPVPYTVGLPTP